MRNKLMIICAIVIPAMMFSCQKNDQLQSNLLDTDLTTSVAEIIGTQVGTVTGATEHGIAVENFNGHSPAFVIGTGNVNYGIPVMGLPGMGKIKFGVPHIDQCATVTVSGTTFPREIVIEYPSTCTDPRGHSKQGKIVITLTDTITNAGAVQTIEYTGFFMDSMKIDMTGTLKNLGKNAAGNWVIEKTYTQKITRSDRVVERENYETEEWVAGFETADRSDNIYYITGSGTVKIDGAVSYTRTITTPLLFDGSCEFLKSGIVELEREGVLSVINYGEGTCDDKATVTTDGTTEEISLHSKKFKHNGRFGRHFHGFGQKPDGDN